MPAHIYISYSRLDEKLALAVAAGLRKQGHKISIYAEITAVTDKWRDAMDRAMEDCNALVVLITQNSLLRPFVNAEIGAARALNKKVIPVVYEDVPQIPSVIDDINCVFATRDKPAPVLKQIEQRLAGVNYKNVFIVHGQNEAKKWELFSFLTTLGLQPTILHEQANLGKTIIEKFEHYARQNTFAFVLLTPDDQAVAANAAEETKARARQNVIMELGWFMAKLGRGRVILLYQKELELPTDISGIIYLKFNDSVKEVGEAIRLELQKAELI